VSHPRACLRVIPHDLDQTEHEEAWHWGEEKKGSSHEQCPIQYPEWCGATRAQKKEELERESELAKRKAEEDAEREDAAKRKQKVTFLDPILSDLICTLTDYLPGGSLSAAVFVTCFGRVLFLAIHSLLSSWSILP
jgi:hypothetical protein